MIAEPDLGWFNELPGDRAETELLACCASARWAVAVAGARPYDGMISLRAASARALAELGWDDILEALAAHPRIGDRIEDPGRREGAEHVRNANGSGTADAVESTERLKDAERVGAAGRARRVGAVERVGVVGGGREARWSRGEQAGMDEAGDETRRAMVDGNREYEKRFGHVFLICATGRGAREMLAELESRLRNDVDTERSVVRAELSKIVELRLAKLVGEG